MTTQSKTKQRPFKYNAEQWQVIKASLALAGVDNYSFMRRRLEVVGWFFLEASSGGTPKQYAGKMRERRDVLKVAHAMLVDDDDFTWENYFEDEDEDWIGFGSRCDQRERVRKELVELIAWTQTRINQLEAMEGGSKNNAKKRHVSFWYELTHLWHEFVPNAACQPHKHLLRFLFACSKPVFPEATDNAKLIAFIERHLPHYVPQTSTISRALIAG